MEEFELISLEEYVKRAVTFMEYLDPERVIQRLVGKGPQDNLIFCNWDTSWWKIKDAIEAEFAKRGIVSGISFSVSEWTGRSGRGQSVNSLPSSGEACNHRHFMTR